MKYFGNILTVYKTSEDELAVIENLLLLKQFPYVVCEHTIFFGTPTIDDSYEFSEDLQESGYCFTHYFVKFKSGDELISHSLPASIAKKMQDVMFGDI